MSASGDLAVRVRDVLPAVEALCPSRIRPTVVATMLNLVDLVEGGGSQLARKDVRKNVAGQLAKVWADGFLLSLAQRRNDLHHAVLRVVPSWHPPETTERARQALVDVRADLPDGLPVAAHVDAGLAFLDSVDVCTTAVDFVAVTQADSDRRRLTWARYVDFHAPPGQVQSALPHSFRFGLVRALRARRAGSATLRSALVEDRFGLEASNLGRGAMPLVAEIAARFPGARFDALDVGIEGGRMVLVPVFADDDMAVRLPMAYGGDGEANAPAGGLVRHGGLAWRFATAPRLPARIAQDAPDSTRAMLDLLGDLATGPAAEAFAFCVLGTRHVLAAPRAGRRGSSDPALGVVVGAVARRGIDLSLGLGSIVTLEEARPFGEWTTDVDLHVARLVSPR